MLNSCSLNCFYTFTCLLIVSGNIYSQQYLSLSGGYGVGVNETDLLDGEIMTVDLEENLLSLTAARYSYGEGFNAHLGFGVFVHPNIYIEGALSYKISDNYSYGQDVFGVLSEISYSGQSLYTSLRLGFNVPLTEKTNLFLEAGPSVGFANSFSISRLVNNSTSFDDFILNEKSSNGLSLGGGTGIGIKRVVSSKVSLSVGLTGLFISFRPNNREVTEYVIDGVSRIDELTISERFTNYSNEIDQFPGASQAPEDQPSRRLKQSHSFSSLSLELGVDYSF